MGNWFAIEVVSEHVHEAGEGGIGNSWFSLDVVSTHVEETNLGGIGYSWFVIDVVSTHVPGGPPTPLPEGPAPDIGGGQQFTFIGGPIEQRFRASFPGYVELLSPVAATLSGQTHLVRQERFEFPGQIHGAKTISFDFQGTRLSSPTLAQMVREDEELLLTW